MYSKHLCGAATDLTINCLRHLAPETVLIALCCHHRCSFDSYCSHDFLCQHDISRFEFDVLTSLSSWATCSQKEGHEEKCYYGLSFADREEIGRTCKFLLDVGRILKLQQLGYAAQLRRYISPEVTLENIALFAKKS